MARKNEYDKFIISASEVGSYVVCPESWRLAQESDQHFSKTSRFKKGEQLHDKWAKDYGTSIQLARQVRLVVSLILLCILIVMMNAEAGLF